MLFCNIGWMSRYEGLVEPDTIVGGGKWVDRHKTGLEVCNFLACPDGNVYGHVETVRGSKERQIRIEAIGGSGDYVDGVDVVWTATDRDKGGRRVIGFYRQARVYRRRQKFAKPPTQQHARDRIVTFRIVALAKNAIRLDLEDRTLVMGRGRGWMGQTPWWVPSSQTWPGVRKFERQTRTLLDGLSRPGKTKLNKSKPGLNSAGATGDDYLRYVEAHEVEITPRHNILQAKFERFIASDGATELRPNVASVDLRYRDAAKGQVLVEVKPCERPSVRYAIRTAIGQLLDYKQRANEEASLLIVLEIKPSDEDCLLATSNGFGIAYLIKTRFEFLWPMVKTAS